MEEKSMNRNSNMNDAINFSNDTYGRGMYTNISGTMPGCGVENHSSRIESGYVLEKYAAMQKQKEESEANERRAKMKSALGNIFLIIWAAVLSVFVVWVMQPMDWASNIVLGVATFFLLAVRLMIIKDSHY